MGDNVARFFSIIRKYGFIKTIQKLTEYFFSGWADKFAVPRNKAEIQGLIEKAICGNYQRVIIRISPFGYDVPLFQRPQHIANSLARNGCLVFYNVSSLTDGVRFIKKLSDNLYLINLSNIYVQSVLKRVEINTPKYIEVYSTDRETKTDTLTRYRRRGYGIIYQYVDRIAPELSGTSEIPKNILSSYRYAMKNKDVFIVATAEALYEDARSMRGRSRLALSTNGVDLSHFNTFEYCRLTSDFKSILRRGRPVICYYGAIASWLDYELIRKIDETEDFSIVLIGVKYDSSHKVLKDLNNTFYLGPRHYEELKSYAIECDVLTIPFKEGEISHSTSPVKLFEYMAIGRPIVCTDMCECRKYKSVLIGKSHSEFISKLYDALALKNNESYARQLRCDAEANDWSIKAKEIISLLLEGE